MINNVLSVKNFLLVFAVALAVRAIYAWYFIDINSLVLEDQLLYIQAGKFIAATGNITEDVSGNYAKITQRIVPGYPILIASIYKLFGESNMAIIILQIIIDSLTCIVIGLIAELVIQRGFMIAGMVSAMNLGMIILSGMILNDTLFLFIFSLFILLIFSYIKYASSYLFFMAIFVLCLSALVRPVSYYLIFLLLPLIIWFFIYIGLSFREMLYKILSYVITVVIMFGVIHYQNYNKYNSFSLVSQGGGHALYWIVPATYQYSGQGSYEDGQKLAKTRLKEAMHRDKFQESSENVFKNSGYNMKVAKEILLDMGLYNILHAWISGSVINLLSPSLAYAPIVRSMNHPSFYGTPGNGLIEKVIKYTANIDGLKYLLLIIVGTLFSIFFLVISIFGFYKITRSAWLNRENRDILIFSLFIIIYFLAITGPIIGIKYRLPLEPLITMFFSYAIVHFKNIYVKNKNV